MLETQPNQIIGETAPTALNPFVSVIIPVYRELERLKICLNSLTQQSYPSDRYEIIVVDNGSDNSESIQALVAQYENSIFTQELTPGSYAARNQGISIAKGEILAFTDSDCIPSPEWLETGVKHLLENPSCGVVGGRIEMFYPDPNNVTITALYDKFIFGFPQQKMIESHGGVITANLFARKAVFDDIGGFLARLKSFGDQEWGMRVRAAGYPQLYAHDAWVSHPVRGSRSEMLKKRVRCSGGVFDLYVRQQTSWWVRYRRLTRLILEELLIYTPILIWTAFQHPELGGYKKRLQVAWVILQMQSASAWEKIRLNFGKQSQRA